MTIAISNLAWDRSEDDVVAGVLLSAGVNTIELAPTKVWPAPLEAKKEDVRAYRQAWEDRGFRIASMQSLLFGRPDLILLGEAESQLATQRYLEGIIDLAAELGAGPLVFGSPKNRKRGDMSTEDAMERSAPLFKAVGDYAAERGAWLCLEANPPQYGADFIVNSDEAARLVRMVNSPGFALHLDLACMTLAGETPEESVRRHRDIIRHFHVSAPSLGPVVYETAAEWDVRLPELGANWRGEAPLVSIEMVRTAQQPLDVVKRAVSPS